jgi:hypothetical protein
MNRPETESPFVIARRNRAALERRAREMRAEQIANLVLAASRGVASGARALARGTRSLWRWALARRALFREHPAR